MRRGGQHGKLTAVAKAANVSVATVSKVVHGRSDVGGATRERIETLLAEHGYVRPWVTAATPRILVVFRDLESPYTLEVVRGVVNAASDRNAHAVIGTTSARPVSAWLNHAEDVEALGLILVISMLTPADQARIVEKGIPVVLIDPLSRPSLEIPSVGVTDAAGARDAVRYLLTQGHRRIGVIAGRSHSLAGAARLSGYGAALREAGITVDPALVRTTDFDHGEAVEATKELLALAEPPTAIFATSDPQAMGVIEGARQRGVAVPTELSVVSFDDTQFAAMASPPLTAVRQPFEEMGRVALEKLLQWTLGPTPAAAALHTELPTTLVERSSAVPPRASGESDRPFSA